MGFEHGKQTSTAAGEREKTQDLSRPNYTSQPAHSEAAEKWDIGREKTCLENLMGPSATVQGLITDVERVASSNFSVLIQGETGSGKEVIAQAIHRTSERSGKPFVPVDCGAIPETLLESELFGHEKGAFTSAERQKPGKFETAQGGTLFLDEISNLPLSSQVKLLRVLQDKLLYHIGGTSPIKADVRLLAATSKNLLEEIEKGHFRQDLFYRLNDFTITIPPLRERKEDILYLAHRFMHMTNRELEKKVSGFSDEALGALLNYSWPGNVRQLRSTIRRAVLLADELIAVQYLSMHNDNQSPPDGVPPRPWNISVPAEPILDGTISLRDMVSKHVSALEKEIIRKILLHTGGNKAKAARLLQVDYKTLHYKIKKLEIVVE